MNQYSYGYRYYYWKFYNGNSNIKDPVDIDTHKNPFRDIPYGTTLGDWYVANKYGTLKNELLNNKICSISQQQWNNLQQKANIYVETYHARDSYYCNLKNICKYYDMDTGSPITSKHLIAMMVYCNISYLCFKFSETFRKLSSKESNIALIERHSNYHNFGRLLRECVECFGEWNNTAAVALNGYIKLWHGINKEFTFSSTVAHIKGPFSTTLEYAVAANFCANIGMILELELNQSLWALESIMSFRKGVFSCAWVSDFANEQEVFTIGGLSPFGFRSIINAVTGTNYEMYLKSLKALNHITTNGIDLESQFIFARISLSSRTKRKAFALERQIIFRLLSHELWTHRPKHRNHHEFKTCPQYIKDILHKHCLSIKRLQFGEDLGHQFYGDSCIQRLFRQDNGWLKLDLIMTVFPNVELIEFRAIFYSKQWLLMSDIYNSVLSFMKTNTITSLQHIIISGGKRNNSEISTFKQYIKTLNRDFWNEKWHIYVHCE
eukprot:312673_1